MEIAVILLVIVVAAIWYLNRDQTLDTNNDGKIDSTDLKNLAENTVQQVKSLADQDGDGKVTVADAKVAVKKTTSAVKRAASRAKTGAKSAARRGSKSKNA